MKLLHYVISIGMSIAVGLIVYFAVQKYQTPKIGYVKVGSIMEKYQGLIDAAQTLEADYKIAQSNMDTVKSQYVAFRKSKPSAEQIRQADQEMAAYQNKFSEDMNRRRNELSQPAIEKINNYIADYGKKHHYKIILGATTDGNILYAEETDDLTQTILNDLNALYTKNAPK